MFPSEPIPFLEVDNPDEALKLAVDHDVYSVSRLPVGILREISE